MRLERRSIHPLDRIRRALGGVGSGRSPARTAAVALGLSVVAPLVAALLVWSAVRDRRRAPRRGFTDACEIPLDAVSAVAVSEGRGPLARPHLTVRYRADGEARRRRVALPSNASGRADGAVDRAVGIFQSRGLTVVED